MNAIESNERVVKCFRDFVAMGGHILKAVLRVIRGASWRGENPRTDPTRVIHHIEPGSITVAGVTIFEVEAMETKYTSIAISLVEVHVGEQEGRNIFRRNISCNFC